MEMIDRLEMPLLPKNIISWRMPFNNKASKLILGGFVFWVVITIDRLTNNLLSYPFFSTIITQAFDAPAGSWLNRWFLKLTQHSSVTPLQAYIEKAQSMVSLIEFVTILFVGVLLLIWVVRKIKTNNRWFLAAGVLLGVTTAVRVLGPAVIGLIVFYIILRKKPQATIILFPYLFVAGIVTYISWPLLWNHPILNIAESLSVMSQFPWTGQVRFEGREFLATQLPWYYLPKLLSIQLTVPLLVLCGTGVGRSIYRFVRRAPGSKISLFLLSWMFLPIVGVILYRPAIYDNFRQFLFILPPFFVFAAIGFEWIIQFIPSKWTAPIFSIVLLLPGIVAGVWLHPYEYVYYNGLVGWTGNINRSFETDYWGTSLCEAARVISNHTSEAATVAVTDHTLGLVFKECASSQLSLLVERADPSTIQPDYSAILTRYDDDLDYFRSMRVITTIGRGNTPFAVVKKTP